jgi:hypothetical protein
MKGKHALESARRREAEAVAAAQELRAELAVANRSILDLRGRLIEQDGMRTEITRLQELVAAGASDEMLSLADKYDSLKKSHDRLAEYVKGLRKNWDKLGDLILALLQKEMGGTRLEALEAFMALIGRPATITYEIPETATLSTSQVRRIQRARGLRSR